MKNYLFILGFLCLPFWSIAQECDDEPIIIKEPQSIEVIENGTVQFSIEATNYEEVFWFRLTGNNSSTLIANNDIYSGAKTTTLTLENVPTEYDGYTYYAYILDRCRESASSVYATLNVSSTYINIPDLNFETALGNLGYDDISGDGQVPRINVEGLTQLDIRNKEIKDLTGIEAFVALESLQANFNELITVDLSVNTSLKRLFIGNNNLTTINLSNNTNLEYLSIGDIDLSSGIDLSNNTSLVSLLAENCNLTSVDLSKNTALSYLELDGNPLTILDITTLTNLESLLLQETSLSAIDISRNLALKSFTFENSNFTSLDFSGLVNLEAINGNNNSNLAIVNLKDNSSLTTIQINNGLLTSLDFSDAVNLKTLLISGHKLQGLDLSNNTALTTIQLINNGLTSLDLRNIDLTKLNHLNISQNPDLICVSVDDVDYATNNFTSAVTYSVGCDSHTYIPDDNFEEVFSAIDDVLNDNFIPTSSIENLTSLDISNKNITDLTGLESFVGLTILNASGNQLKIVDFSKNINLEKINLENNKLLLLDVSSLINLNSLNVNTNDLLELNIQNGINTSLDVFDARNNSNLTCIVVDNETYAITNFTDIDNQTNFNEAECTAYVAIEDTAFETALAAYDDIENDNQIPIKNILYLTDLDVKNKGISDLTGIEYFVSLASLNCSENALTTLNLSENLKLKEIDCDRNSFISLDFSNNSYLTNVDADDMESLTSIDFTGCTLLREAEIDNNSISTIDFTSNINLKVFDLDNNKLTSIDLTNNTILENADLSYNNISVIDLSKNVMLNDINLESNNLTNIDLSNNTALQDFDIDFNQVTSLDFSNNHALKRIDIDDNPLLTKVTFGNSLYNLATVYADETAIETIDVSSLFSLLTLDLGETNLQALDISKNTQLNNLRVDNANLSLLKINNGNNSNFSRMEANGNPNLVCIQVDDVDFALNNWTAIDNQSTFSTGCESCTMNARVILEGPFNSSNFEMSDDLRANNLLPTTSPYSDRAICEESVFENSNVVDWIEIQFRNASDISEIVARKSFLLQKNSGVTTIDGSSKLSINAWQGNYYVAIAHRNHLTAVTKSPITFNENEANIDFTSDESVFNGTNALIEVTNSVFALPAGSVEGNGQIQNSGINSTIQKIGISGYNIFDVDMNGQIQNIDVNTVQKNVGKGEQF